jgi:hypothetical protein
MPNKTTHRLVVLGYTMFAPARLLRTSTSSGLAIKSDSDFSVTGWDEIDPYMGLDVLLTLYLFYCKWLLLGCVLNWTLCIIRKYSIISSSWNWYDRVPLWFIIRQSCTPDILKYASNLKHAIVKLQAIHTTIKYTTRYRQLGKTENQKKPRFGKEKCNELSYNQKYTVKTKC